MSRQALVPLVLPADPVEPMEAATKQYVDAHVPEGGGGSGFTFVQDTTPVPEQQGDTWFNNADSALGGVSSVAIDRGDRVLIWVQFSPGGGGGGAGVEPPIGSITEFINVIPPERWVVMEGQTVVDGEHLHPALWLVIPDTMKVGSDIVFPDTRGRGSMGYDALNPLFDAVGKVGGSPHAVAVSHNHTASSGTVSSWHTHYFALNSGTVSSDHYHGSNINSGNISADHTHAVAMDVQGNHSHGWGHGTTFIYFAGAGGYGIPGGSGWNLATWLHEGNHSHNAWSGTMSAHHWHNVNGTTGWISHNHVHHTAGWTGDPSLNHVHAVTVDFNGADGANLNLQPFIVFPKIIRVM